MRICCDIHEKRGIFGISASNFSVFGAHTCTIYHPSEVDLPLSANIPFFENGLTPKEDSLANLLVPTNYVRPHIL